MTLARPCSSLLPVALAFLVAVSCTRRPRADGPRAPRPVVALEGWRWVPVTDVSAELSETHDGVAVRFNKTGEERRLVALETMPDGEDTDAKSVAVVCRLRLETGAPPRLAFLAFDRDGGVWYTLGPRLESSEAFREIALPAARLREAAFSQDTDGQLTRDALTKAWVGLVHDGPARGTLEVRRVAFSPEPYRPAGPLPIAVGERSRWHASQDRAVRSELAVVPEGPEGAACLKYAWTQPGGRHMYAIPHVAVPGEELVGYTALRLTYRATLPEGIAHLFVALQEDDGAQYYTDSTVPASEEWKTVTVPLETLKLGSWSSDENAQLDLPQVSSVAVGCHGTSASPTSRGVLRVARIEFLP